MAKVKMYIPELLILADKYEDKGKNTYSFRLKIKRITIHNFYISDDYYGRINSHGDGLFQGNGRGYGYAYHRIGNGSGDGLNYGDGFGDGTGCNGNGYGNGDFLNVSPNYS